jgi:hypothetical protein
MKVLVGSLADAERNLAEVIAVRHNLVGEKEGRSWTGVEVEELRSWVVEDSLLVAVGSLVGSLAVGGIDFGAGIESGLLLGGSSSLGWTSWLSLL